MASKTTSQIIKINNQERYSDEYREACFFAWYRAGKPKLGMKTVLGTVIPTSEDGFKPNSVTLKKWREEYGWLERADVLDAQVSKVLENEAIQERIETLRQLAKDGKTLKEKGLDYIREHDRPFEDNPSAAVRAIVAGSEMEFRYAGQAAVLSTIGQMSNKQVESEIKKLLGGRENDVEPEMIDSEIEDDLEDEEELGESEIDEEPERDSED